MKNKKNIVKVLLCLLIVFELFSVVMMIHGKDYLGTIVHGILAILFTFLGIYSINNLSLSSNHSEKKSLEISNSWVLIIISLIMLNMIAIHDFDHMRQAMNWNYKFTLPVLLVNFIVYLPNWLAILLISKRKYIGAIVSVISGPLIGLSFLKVHLLGAFIPVWGLWNDSFFTLGADKISWWILTLTAIVGVAVGMSSIFLLGMEKQKNQH